MDFMYNNFSYYSWSLNLGSNGQSKIHKQQQPKDLIELIYQEAAHEGLKKINFLAQQKEKDGVYIV